MSTYTATLWAIRSGLEERYHSVSQAAVAPASLEAGSALLALILLFYVLHSARRHPLALRDVQAVPR